MGKIFLVSRRLFRASVRVFSMLGFLAVTGSGVPLSFGATINQVGGAYGNWPTSWTPLPGINDAKDGVSSQLDFVGDTSYWGGYIASDANYVYFRARVAAGTVTSSTFRDTIWILIDKRGYGADDGRPDYAFAWDSKSNNNSSHGIEMQVLQTKGDSWQHTRMDDIDGDSSKKSANDINGNGRTGDGYLRTIDSQDTGADHFGMTSFIDVAISWNYLNTYTVLGQNQQWNVTFGSIANATDHNPITADVAGGATPADAVTVGWSSTVPEPATLLMLTVGGLAVLRRRHRR